MYAPISKEDALKHMMNAMELEYDRLFIEEILRLKNSRIEVISHKPLEEQSAGYLERSSGYTWRKVIMALALDAKKG